MERFFSFLTRLRQYPEPLRRQIFWLSVVGCVFVIGFLWVFTLPWQLHRVPQEDGVEEVSQPTLSETLTHGGAALTDVTRSTLRDFLLGDGPQPQPQETTEAPEDAPVEDLPRLPRAE